jgi:RNA polymerase sigma-70 factor (ECF subfamily)
MHQGDVMNSATRNSSSQDHTTQNNTVELLVRLRAGDEAARDRLVERARLPLARWLRGRLPRWARTMSDTQDIVQDVLVRAMPHLESFQAERPGSLLAYLKRSASNQVIDEIRMVQRRKTEYDVPESYPDPSPSPLERTIHAQGLEQYRAALATLSASDQALIVERMERQLSYADVAVTLGKSNANAARVGVSRALARLVKALVREAEGRRLAS